MTVPGVRGMDPGLELRQVPEGIELRIVTLEYEGETEDEFKANLEKGIGRSVISRTGVCDSYGDVIEEGAFVRKTVDLLPNHSWNSPHPPIGALTAMPKKGIEEIVGKWRLNLTTTLGVQWRNHLQFSAEYGKKAIQEFSIGFRVIKSKWLDAEEREKRKDKCWRIIQKLDLLECSMVVSGAMTGTQVLEMRQKAYRQALETAGPDPEDVRMAQEFDRLLAERNYALLHSAPHRPYGGPYD